MVRSTKSTESLADEDAFELLKADHQKVKGLFKQFKQLKQDEGSEADKTEVVKEICEELKIHTQIEEELFYPAVREAISADEVGKDEDLMDEALVEHAGAKDLIAQLEEMDADDELFDAKVTVLSEQIDHHVKEEEGEMFPKAKRAKLDKQSLGAQMAVRKAELKSTMSSKTSTRSPKAASAKSSSAR
jgi:hemerythrin superfamily protein